jgi:hypothetical protein
LASPAGAAFTGRGLVPATHLYELNNALALNAGTAPATIVAYSALGGQTVGGGNVYVSASTVYEVDFKGYYTCAAALTSTSVQFTFAAGATVAIAGTNNFNYDITYWPGASGTISTAASISNWYGTAAAFPSITAAGAVIATAQTPTAFTIRVKGMISVSTAGTLMPAIGFSGAPGQVITAQPGSYFKLTPIGVATGTGTAGGNVTIGNFTTVF